ncbi:MAG: HlyD family secretion protein [Bacteroidales bacterium]|jgi:multidrug resistance efflux pump|nr:HlyD family secretion protein [Bacteroidales bacterium]
MAEQEKINKKELKNIEIRSEEFQEILGATPHWLLRSGILVILIVVIVILIGSYFFKYPDIITSQVSIVTQNPPVPLKSFSTGKITHLFYSENQQVKEDSVIAIIENTAYYPDVIYLKSIMDTLTNFEYFPEIVYLNLGEIQTSYSGLNRNIKSYKNFKKLDYHNNKIESTKKQISENKQYYSQLLVQSQLLKQELDIAEKQFQRDKKLHEQNVYSKADYEKAEQTYLQQRRNYESFQSTLTNTQMQITQLEQQILDLELQKIQETDNYEVQIHETFDGLKSQLSQWEKSYLIKSPITGRATFTEVWSKNQTVQAGQTVATIVPNEETEIIGKVTIPSTGVGKIKTGHPVNIKLDNYPHMEFGMLKANVKNISLVPVETEDGVFYISEIELPPNFTSNYGKQLQFSQNMTGTAEIITDDVRLLERFLNPIRSLWKKNIDY